MQGRELNGLWAMAGRPPQPWVPQEEVRKTSTPEEKMALPPAAVKAKESPPLAPLALARLSFSLDDEGRVRGHKGPRQPNPSSCSWNPGTTTRSSEEVEEVHPNLRKPPKEKKAATKRKG